jgi:protein-L-isoaspartate(D-aspartate) O-methyltransferase
MVKSGSDNLDDRRAAERSRMVEDQIAARGVRDPRVLEALRTVPRHRFIPGADRAEAYEDRPVAIGCGQTISQPYMVAVMTEWLDVDPAGRILEIGTGSGYQTAVLARLARHVITVERHRDLSDAARKMLSSLALDNIEFVVADGSLGCPRRAPYDGILVTAGAPRLAQALLDQLDEGGKLVAPVGGRDEQRLVRVTRAGDQFRQEFGIGCRFVPLLGAEGWPGTP